jgi:ABC-type protease/lipase transport system fused ATPase/permease subunit
MENERKIERAKREQRFTEQAQVASESERTVSPTQSNKSAPKVSGFSSALKICGVIDLIIGILAVIGMLFILSKTASSKSETALIVMLAVALQGFFFYVLFNVIAEIAESLRAILHKLSERN